MHDGAKNLWKNATITPIHQKVITLNVTPSVSFPSSIYNSQKNWNRLTNKFDLYQPPEHGGLDAPYVCFVNFCSKLYENKEFSFFYIIFYDYFHVMIIS